MKEIERPAHRSASEACPIERDLTAFEAYISTQVADLMTGHTGVAHPSVLDLEIDELTQRVRIKLWRVLKDRPIERHRAYIKCIVRSEFYDMLRRRKKLVCQFQTENEDEPIRGHVLITLGEGMADPAEEFEHHSTLLKLIDDIVQAVLKLPTRQQHAMLYSLLQESDDPDQLIQAFKRHKLDLRAIHWPSDKAELRLLKASLSAARKNMLKNMEHACSPC